MNRGQSSVAAPRRYPVLRWMTSHVSVETDAAGNLKPSKKKSTDRIDGLVAAIMDLGRAQVKADDSGLLLVTFDPYAPD